jgi:hypothetical protein
MTRRSGCPAPARPRSTSISQPCSRSRLGLGWPGALLALALGLTAAAVTSCVVVPQQRARAHLADPIMAFDEDPLEAYSRHKFHSTREGAAGGSGESAGGGCGCQ